MSAIAVAACMQAHHEVSKQRARRRMQYHACSDQVALIDSSHHPSNRGFRKFHGERSRRPAKWSSSRSTGSLRTCLAWSLDSGLVPQQTSWTSERPSLQADFSSARSGLQYRWIKMRTSPAAWVISGELILPSWAERQASGKLPPSRGVRSPSRAGAIPGPEPPCTQD